MPATVAAPGSHAGKAGLAVEGVGSGHSRAHAVVGRCGPDIPAHASDKAPLEPPDLAPGRGVRSVGLGQRVLRPQATATGTRHEEVELSATPR